MTTEPLKPRRPRAEVEAEIMEEFPQDILRQIEEYVSKHGFVLFCNKATYANTARSFRTETRITMPLRKISVAMKFVNKKLSEKNKRHLWMKRLKPVKSLTDAYNEYWDKLKVAVEHLGPLLVSISIDTDLLGLKFVNTELAERIVRTKISTNVALLRGLPSRLRLWE